MDWDVFYSCETSSREQVTKLVNLLGRYAQDEEMSYKVVSLPNKRLVLLRGSKKPVNVDLYGFVFTGWSKKSAEQDKAWSHGQFVFDFLRRGRLVSLALPRLELYQSPDEEIPCLWIGDGGYWSSEWNYEALPRFLALCKVRYLPELHFSSGDGKAVFFQRKICESEGIRTRLLNLSEAAFYNRVVKELGVLG